MKKNNLFKVIGIVILLYVVLSFIIPVSSTYGVLTDLATSPIGVFRVLGTIFEAFGGFSSLLVFVLLVGAFYAILNATGVYKRYITSIADKFKGKEKLFLIVTMIVIALVSSICGLEMVMFFIFPLIISIIILMGYDRLVALSATFGATIIGMYGATFAGTLYNVNNQILEITVYDGFYVKVVLLVIGTALLVWYTLFHAKLNKDKVKNIVEEVKEDKKTATKGKVKKAAEAIKEVVVEEVSEDLILADIVDKKDKKNCPTWPITLVICLCLLIFILGSTDFNSIFGINIFSEINTFLTDIKIGDYAIWDNVFGGFASFGTWFTPYRFQYVSLVLVMATLVLCIGYRIGVSEAFDSYVEGVKKYTKPAVLTVLACSVFVLTYYYPVFTTVGSWIMSLTDTFNIATTALFSFLGGAFYMDIYYFTYYALSYIGTVAADTALNPLISIMFVNMYSLAMLIAPTSVMLLASLSITDTSYTKWIKYIWKLFAILAVLSLVVFIVYYSCGPFFADIYSSISSWISSLFNNFSNMFS